MITFRRRPGGWCDVDKELLVYLGTDNVVHIELSGVETLVRLPSGEAPCLYLRCALTDTGKYGIVCQGQSGQALLSLNGEPFIPIGSCGGQNAVEIVAGGNGFTVIRQTGARSASFKTIDLSNGQVHDQDFAIQETSQGFWDGFDLTDTIRGSVSGLLLPSKANELVVGQDPTSDDVRYSYKGTIGTLCPGPVYEPRITWFAVSNMWRMVTRSNYNEFIDALIALPLPVTAPQPPTVPPTPPVTPPVTPPEVPTVSLLSTIQAVRAEYGATMNDDQCAELCNKVAWLHRNDPQQWGLSYKDSGTHGVLKNGTPVAHDIIMSGVTKEGFDVLVSAGAQSTPTWGSVGLITNPARFWVAPVDPGTGTVPSPNPVPTPTPTPVNCKFVAGKDYSGELAALKTQVDQLAVLIQGIVDAVKAVEKRNEELTLNVLGAVDQARKDIASVQSDVSKLPKTATKCRLQF